MNKNKVLKIVCLIVLFLIVFIMGYLLSYNVSRSDNNKNKNDNKTTKTTTKLEKKENNKNDLLSKILTNDVMFNAKVETDFVEVKEFYLRDYYISDYGFKPLKYTFIDMDLDGDDELVIVGDITNNKGDVIDGYNLVFNISGNMINCYEFSYRSMISLKNDSSYTVSGGESYTSILKIKSFNDLLDEIPVVEEALADESDGVYTVNSKEVTKEEFDKYFKEFNNKKDVSWINIK